MEILLMGKSMARVSLILKINLVMKEIIRTIKSKETEFYLKKME